MAKRKRRNKQGRGRVVSIVVQEPRRSEWDGRECPDCPCACIGCRARVLCVWDATLIIMVLVVILGSGWGMLHRPTLDAWLEAADHWTPKEAR